LVGGKKVEVKDAPSLPPGKFELVAVSLKFFQGRQPASPITDLLPLAGLQSLKVLYTATLRDPAFLRERLAEGDCFLEEITRKGKIMYESRHA